MRPLSLGVENMGKLTTETDSDIKVNDEELGPFLNQENIVKLTDGTGSYATLAVFHGLHCVERMHHTLYPDHYYPNMTEQETLLLRIHSGMHSTTTYRENGLTIGEIEHCLDYLRQYVQCNADTTLIPMYWPSRYVFSPPLPGYGSFLTLCIAALNQRPWTAASTSASRGGPLSRGWLSIRLSRRRRAYSCIPSSVRRSLFNRHHVVTQTNKC